MKNILISSFDMEVGGVERSLISMLNNFDYQKNNVDLFLYSHTGDFLNLLSPQANLLEEIKEYKTVRQSLYELMINKHYQIVMARLFAKFKARIKKTFTKNGDSSYIQSQYIWKYCLPFFPKHKKSYDVAISYLWPHDFIAKNVDAKIKIAWIHTDYSTVTTDVNQDLSIWKRFNYIISISDDCTDAFLKTYPSLASKMILVENITSPDFIKQMSLKNIENNLFKKENFNLLSVGRFCHQKAFDKAVQSLKAIHDSGYTNVKWFIIGYGPDENLLKKLISENKLESSFILLGKQNNPYPFMKACDLYVQPSRYEGKAVTVSEAKILGKPILITNYPTAQSQIENNVDGVICLMDIEEIASSIIGLYNDNDLRIKLTKYCQSQNYSNKEELEKLYHVIDTPG